VSNHLFLIKNFAYFAYIAYLAFGTGDAKSGGYALARKLNKDRLPDVAEKVKSARG